jgi:hypothetical protein
LNVSISYKGLPLDFSTTLLREKFIIREMDNKESSRIPMTAVSNRVMLPLIDHEGKTNETFVVRAHTMHSCLRMATKLLQTYDREGPILTRQVKYNYESAWEKMNADHESQYNLDKWIAVYSRGRKIFEDGKHHAFLDVIEKCDVQNKGGSYETSLELAEQAFEQMGKKVTITHDSSIGMVMTIKKDKARCGLILRNPNKRTTFNFAAVTKDDPINIGQSLSVAAAFLEAIQLCFQVGMINEKLRVGIIDSFSHESRKGDSARKRLEFLKAEISALENRYDVNYRIEKPDFGLIIQDAESFAKKLYKSGQLMK